MGTLIALAVLNIGVLIGYLIGLAVAKKVYIYRACEWLCEHIDDYARVGEDGAWVEHCVVRDFKEAMEE